MTAFWILVTVSVLLRGLGRVVRYLASWEVAVRLALAVMFTFTGATHFSALKHDYAAMIPDALPAGMWVIYLTGALEIAGAAGLLVPRLRRPAGVCLILLLVALFPANVSAALREIPFRGQPPTTLWLRGPIQLLFVAALWWTSVKPRPEP